MFETMVTSIRNGGFPHRHELSCCSGKEISIIIVRHQEYLNRIYNGSSTTSILLKGKSDGRGARVHNILTEALFRLQ